MIEINERHQNLLECGEQVHVASVEDVPTWVPVPVMVGDKQVGTVTLDTPARMIKDEFTLDMWYKRHKVTHREREDQWPDAQAFRVYPILEYHKAAEFRDYTYNGVTVKATRRRPSSRDDKKYERTILVDGKERIVHYGDPDMPMRRDEPDRRENFLARHNCDEKKDPTKPGWWSCYDWSNTEEKALLLMKQHTGVMIGLFLSPADATALAIPDGEPPDELHVTLAYLGDSKELTDRDVLERVVSRYAQGKPVLQGVVSGTGVFTGGMDGDVLWLHFDSGELPAFRQGLVETLDKAGFPVKAEHGFTPHITLMYAPAIDVVPQIADGRELTFDRLTLAWGGKRTEYPLGGGKMKETENKEVVEDEKAIGDLAKHLLDKYGPEHLFTDCMGDEATQDYDEEARKAVCARVHYEAVGKWPAEKKEENEKGLAKQLELKDEEIARLKAELQKQESLNEKVDDVRRAFDAQFPSANIPMPDNAWVRDVHDSYVVVDDGGKFWRVSYSLKDSEYVFAPRQEWVEGDLTTEFIEKAMEECVCPKCGYKEEHERGEPCASKECLECGVKMERLMEKATWTTAYVNTLPDSSFLYVEDGDKDEEGKTKPRSKRHFPYRDADGKIDVPHLRNAIQRIPQSNAPGLTEEKKKALQEKARKLLEKENKEAPKEEKAGRRLRKPMVQKLKDAWETLKELMSWAEYEDQTPDDDFFRSVKAGFAVKRVGNKAYLITHSTNSFQDRDNEFFSTPGLEKYVKWANKTGERGAINFWHIPNTDFATKVWQGVEGCVLVEVSEFDNTPLGQYALKFFENYPEGYSDYGPWGCSPEFSYLPNERHTGVFDNFQIVRTSVLPRSKAANIWTKAEVSKMAVNEEQKEALEELAGADLANEILEGARTQTKELEEQGVAHKEAIDLEALAGELAKQFDVKLEPLQEQGQALEELAELVKALTERLDAVEKVEKAKAENEVPRFSLTLQKRASQAEETVVPEGDELLEKKPKEPDKPKSGAAAFFGDK